MNTLGGLGLGSEQSHDNNGTDWEAEDYTGRIRIRLRRVPRQHR